MTAPFTDCPCRGRRVPQDYCYWEATLGACNDRHRSTFTSAYHRAVTGACGAYTGTGISVTAIATTTYFPPHAVGGGRNGGSGGGLVVPLLIDEQIPIEHLLPEVGEIIAWRCWLYKIGQIKLRSISQDYYWDPLIPASGEPTDFGAGGIYGLKNRADAQKMMMSPTDVCIVLGSVRMWGEVIDCERGYQAQYARVNSLDEIIGPLKKRMINRFTLDSVLKTLRERYGVE